MSSSDRLSSNWALNTFAALLHFLQFIIAFSLPTKKDGWFNGNFPIYKQVPVWMNKTDAPVGGQTVSVDSDHVISLQNFEVSWLNVKYAIGSFFLLSAIFQGYASFASISYEPGKRLDYTTWQIDRVSFQSWSSRLRYWEFSISASVMLLCIGAESGVVQVYTLVCMFALCAVTMLLGALAQLLFEMEVDNRIVSRSIWAWQYPYWLGWLTCVFAYAPILDSFYSAQKQSPLKAPAPVEAIIWVQFVLFTCFGLVQGLELSSASNSFGDVTAVNKIRKNATFRFIILSFTAKTLLCWMVLAPLLVGPSPQK